MTWHTANGATVDGEINGVYGSLIHLTGHHKGRFVGLETLTDEETRRVADYLKQFPDNSTWENSRAGVTRTLRGSLQILQDDKLVPYDPAAKTEPQVYLIYFSAGWCGPCHRFTPSLVEFYTRLRAALPHQFEIIYVSDDRNSDEQLSYVREFKMPWPVLKYSEVGHAPIVERWAGDGIPCLVALTRDGDLIFHTYAGEEYLGPQVVVDAIERLAAPLAGTDPAIRRARHRLAVMQYLDAVGSGSSPAQPYLVFMDAKRLGDVTIPKTTVRLDIDVGGRVTNLEFDEAVGPVLAGLIQDDIRQWLFLPAVRDGKASAANVRVPIEMTRPSAPLPVAAAGS